MSGIGLAAAIAGLIKFVQPVVNGLGPSAHGKQDLQRLVGLLISLAYSYDALQKFIVESPEDQHSAIRETLENPQDECVKVLSLLRMRLETQKFLSKFIRGAKWDKNLDTCIRVLEDVRNSFDLALHVDPL